MLLGEIISHFHERLTSVMELEEAHAVTSRVVEHFLSLKRVEQVLNKGVRVQEVDVSMMMDALARLLTHEPLQYVLGSAPFMGYEFLVDPSVLIPRPETEELVGWILDTTSGSVSGKLVDFGTGSGCIPISFALKRPGWSTEGVDKSVSALETAKRNSERLNAPVRFGILDMLAYDAQEAYPSSGLDVMVSNPPYIPAGESESMETKVTGFEPAIALFTPEDDPLLFYRALQRLASVFLAPGGFLFLEVHERYARETLRLFNDESFTQPELRSDLSGKPRMIRVRKAYA
ncbi:MAG: hypothetical protein RL213_49 [Bacteroidota bacterium]